jgi:hypothetical protein
MTNEWQSLRVDRLLQHIQLEAKGLEILEKRSRSRDLTDEELEEFEERQRVLSKASDALRIKFS